MLSLQGVMITILTFLGVLELDTPLHLCGSFSSNSSKCYLKLWDGNLLQLAYAVET